MKTPNRIIGRETDTELLAQSAGEFSHEPAEKQAGPVDNGLVPNQLARCDISRGRAGIAFAAMLALSAACTGNEDAQDKLDPQNIDIAQMEHGLMLRHLNPPPAPIPLPLENGRLARVSQRANDTPTHNSQLTLNAVDLVPHDSGVDAVAPISGRISFIQGNCSENADHSTKQICDNRCNSGWGNSVLLDTFDNRRLLISHCDSFPSPRPANGSLILRGTKICEVGCTGKSDGVHIHIDQVKGDNPNYVSQGVGGYITAASGQPLSVQRPRTMATCCGNGCDEATGTSACKEFVAFNQSLAETLRSFAEDIAMRDPNIRRLVGNITPNATESDGVWMMVRQPIEYSLNGNIIQASIRFWVGGFYGNGIRNPFVDTAWFYIEETATKRQLTQWGTKTRVYSEHFIKFDMYDLMTAYVSPSSREAVPVPQQIDAFPNWDRNWELHRALLNINGLYFYVFTGVYKSNRGVRIGCYYNVRDKRWTPQNEWVVL